ncbi:uncharacterized protein LOC142588199 [Dermacentor variabilis]|uniref:uncharacterized protein LOC142588199 n=1 Tax=Dermacentor variabilis TaxID=34621 RepID=UPI003F5B3D0A
MALSSRDLWGVLRGSCNEPFCDCRRYIVVCSSDDPAENSSCCDYCNHCPGAHGRLTDLEQNTEMAGIPQQGSQPGCPKDWCDWAPEGERVRVIFSAPFGFKRCAYTKIQRQARSGGLIRVLGFNPDKPTCEVVT